MSHTHSEDQKAEPPPSRLVNENPELGHTPGPWHFTAAPASHGNGRGTIFAEDGYAICNTITYHGRHGDHAAEHNARLIAAAPDLLAALKGVLRCSALPDHWRPEIVAAIAKATGVAA